VRRRADRAPAQVEALTATRNDFEAALELVLTNEANFKAPLGHGPSAIPHRHSPVR
jgi:hypothetical protein